MPAIDLRTILEETASNGTGDLVTRSTGQAVRSRIVQALAGYRGEQVAIIDFSSVRLIDLSCADEIIAKLLVQHGGARCFLLRGVSDDHADALEPVLEHRGLAAAVQDRSGRLRVLGHIPELVRRMFSILAERGTAKVEEVAAHLAVPPAVAREVFDELLERRLATAAAGGNQVVTLA